MPLTRVIADALGVVTICLVSVLFLLGLFCILYSFYFHSRIHSQGFTQLRYFGGPWIIRIVFILVAIWWGFGEIVRLNLLRHHGRLLNSLDVKWQKNVCRGYILSNLGFAEPCFFLALAFLLRASLQKSGTLGPKWNGRTMGYILLFCLPMFFSQLMVILIGPVFKMWDKLPFYFYRSASNTKAVDRDTITFCTYPLLSTILLGLFASIISTYFFWIGRRILHLVINKALRRRIYTLLYSVPGCLLFRVLLLGISVRLKPNGDVFEAVTFLAFLSLVCCIGVGICMLVYFPIADSLAMGNVQNDIEARRRFTDEHNETVSLIANQSRLGESTVSPVRTSEASTKCGSISFRTLVKDEGSFLTLEKDEGSRTFVELSIFSPGRNSTPPGSPRLVGWPMLPSAPIHEP